MRESERKVSIRGGMLRFGFGTAKWYVLASVYHILVFTAIVSYSVVRVKVNRSIEVNSLLTDPH